MKPGRCGSLRLNFHVDLSVKWWLMGRYISTPPKGKLATAALLHHHRWPSPAETRGVGVLFHCGQNYLVAARR